MDQSRQPKFVRWEEGLVEMTVHAYNYYRLYDITDLEKIENSFVGGDLKKAKM